MRSAIRMMKEGGMDAIKIEGGFSNRVKAVGAVVEAGVAVMGHVGLTPQSISVLGGFRPAGQSGGRWWGGATRHSSECMVACYCTHDWRLAGRKADRLLALPASTALLPSYPACSL